ncbi:dihydroorotase [Sneathiella chinensis]|uniref:Dihydroorotase n=1 Tax=Sneathiella chinensis TaxID=349750 RepID=A0ABQ5U5Q6_9PROT|nr:dihydroorotase [Sneathiella chinensis]GLQ05816.1 dihydroorotase [Sneathiella chinensis]
MKADLIIKNGTVVSARGIETTDIAVVDGKISAFGNFQTAEAAEVVDATGLHVFPGVIDSQVHFREPGLEHKEDLATGTAAAALGGVTAIFEMPNTKPLTLTEADMQDKVRRGREKAWTDFAFFIGAAAENVSELPKLERTEGVAGVKLFMGSSTGSLLVDRDEDIRRVLENGVRRVAIHAEDEPRLLERQHLAVDTVLNHPVWRDAECALRATQRVLKIARETGRRIHVLHVTTKEEMALLAEYKDVATVEVTPQHLTLSSPDCYEQLGSYAQMNPPIREEAHRAGLWKALRDGVVDVIGSDHAPHTKEEKAKPYPQSPSGMPGVQTLFPLMLDHCNKGELSLQHLMDLTSAGPARVYGIAGKGRLSLGYDGDFTLVDMKRKQEITEDWLASKCGWSPFAGKTVQGWPVATIIRGNIVMRDGELQGASQGQPVRFQECL